MLTSAALRIQDDPICVAPIVDRNGHARRSATREAWLISGAIVTVVFACTQILMFPFGRDQGVYAIIADRMLAGATLYRDAWDIKPPALYYTYALAQWLFGRRMVSVRVLEVIGVLSLYFPTRTIGRALYDSTEAGICAWALAALAYALSEYWYTGQSESFGAILTIWAVAITVTPTPRFGPWCAWITTGLLFGLAFLFKPQIAFSAIPCAAYAGWTEWRRTGERLRVFLPALAGGAGSVVPIGACAVLIWHSGGWDAMYDIFFRYLPAHTAIRAPLVPIFGAMTLPLMTVVFFVIRLPALVLIGLVAAAVLRPDSGRGAAANLLICSAIALQLVGVGIAGKLFAYHYFAALLLAAVVAGDGLAKLWRRYRDGRFAGAFTLFVLIAIGGILLPAVRHDPSPSRGETQFWHRSAIRTAWMLGLGASSSKQQLDSRLYNLFSTDLGDCEQAAGLIDATTEPSDSIFVWGAEARIYWLANRQPASRFVYDFPLRLKFGREQSRATLMRELEASAPAVIVVESGDTAPDIVGDNLDSKESLKTFAQLEAYLNSNFVPVANIGTLKIFRRHGPRTASMN